MQGTRLNSCISGLAFVLLVHFFFSCETFAADLHIYPAESFREAVANLEAGDVLTVHEGIYRNQGRVSISVKGTKSSPVVIRAAAGESRPHITRRGAPRQNTINIEGAEYLTITGLEISGKGGDGINMRLNPSFITLDDLVIHDIAVGINFRSDMHDIVVRGNHIYHTSRTGEGLYVGCNYARCAVSNSVIENNWIHDTLEASQGDGIEIKNGSHSNIIRNNVIHDTNFPCIMLYGTEGNPRNIVEGNVVWGCGDAGIHAAADTIIRNNVILQGPGSGFDSHPHQGVLPANLEFVHNTVFGGNPCLRLIRWSDAPGMVFANNAVYCSSGNFGANGLSGVTVSGNVLEPATRDFPSSGYVTGRSRALDFVDVSSRTIYPTSDSALRGAAAPMFATTHDYNEFERRGDVDAGAYDWTGTQNPGWRIAAGFKHRLPEPVISLSAKPTAVDSNGQSMLSWSTLNVDGCVASDSWSGSKPVHGNESTARLVTSSTFILTCQSASGSVSQTVTVDVVGGGPAASSDQSAGAAN